MESFSPLLLRWFTDAQRELPWRMDRNPYAIFLSEVILQQTRVAQGNAYFVKFLEKYPTVEDLAAAPLDSVLALWSGLGYYNRARNLHRAAQHITQNWGGHWREDVADWMQLPGVGPYTAGAVCSIAFDTQAIAVDGNVERVLSRIFHVTHTVGTAEAQRAFNAAAWAILPPKRTGQHNQALMELGSLICTPRQPKCAECPVASLCAVSFQPNAAEALPVKKKNAPVKEVILEWALYSILGHVALRKRTEKGIWQGLYEPPSREAWETDISWTGPDTFSHVLSHRKLFISLYWARNIGGANHLPPPPEGCQWIPLDKRDEFGLPAPLSKAILKKMIYLMH